MFENILKGWLKICEYSRENQQNYGDVFFNQHYQHNRFYWLSYQTPCLFYFRKVKVVCVEETHMMIVAF